MISSARSCAKNGIDYRASHSLLLAPELANLIGIEPTHPLSAELTLLAQFLLLVGFVALVLGFAAAIFFRLGRR